MVEPLFLFCYNINIIKAITKRIEETVELASNSGKSLDNILDTEKATREYILSII